MAQVSPPYQSGVPATIPSSQGAQRGMVDSSSSTADTGTAQRLTSDGKPQGQGLRLLSLDGGGIRGLSELIILREILQRIRSVERLSQVPLPCEYFDLIGGTSTGGLIALLLGRLRLPIEVAINHYARFAEEVFSATKWGWQDGRFSATKFEEIIKGIIQAPERDTEETMLDPGGNYEVCKTFVCAMPAAHMSNPRLFRTYSARKHESDSCPIWQAARATSAAPTFFKRIKIGREEFVDGGMGCNNPAGQVLEEASLIFPPQSSIACIISIGTGQPDVVRLRGPNLFQRVVPTDVVKALQGIATDCERVAADIHKRFEEPGVYFRFNVEQGMQNVMLEQWERLGDVETHTRQYMLHPEVDRKIDAAVEAIIARRAVVPTKHIGGMVLANISRPVQEQLALHAAQVNAGQQEQKQDEQQDKHYHEIRKWLRCKDGDEHNQNRHRRNATKLLEGTGDWLLQTDRYLKWYRGDSPIIWLCANPGFGKSTLCSRVIDAIKSDPRALVVFHFYEFDQLQNTASKTLRLLAEQLLRSLQDDIHLVSNELHQQTRKSMGDLKNVCDLIKILVKAVSKTCYFLIDGLDEETVGLRWTEAQTALDFLVELSKTFPDSVRLWYSSQEITSITKKLGKFTFNVNDQVTGDVMLYLLHNIPRLDGPEVSTEVWDDVMRNLASRAGGNFLWASLMVGLIEGGELGDLNTIKWFIENSLPNNLNSYYRQIFARFEKNNPSLASKFFSLVTFARRPLRVKEIGEAIGILQSSHPASIDAGAVPIGLAWCERFAPLIEIQRSDSGDCTCRLYHSTVRTFLLNHPEILSDGTSNLDLRIGHHMIFNACLLYLSQDRYQKLLVKKDGGWVDTLGKPATDHYFLPYSAKYWNKHVPETDAARASIRNFLTSSNFLTCIQAQSLFVEAQFGLFRTVGEPETNEKLRRLFPPWFAGHHEDGQLWRDFRVFMHEWRYLLDHGSCQNSQCPLHQYAGEIDRCLWGALGAQNFMSRFTGRYTSFKFQSEVIPMGQCYEGVSVFGDELRLLRLESRDTAELRFACEHWRLSGDVPPVLQRTQLIFTDENSTNWLLYMKYSGTNASMRAGRASPVSFSDDCRLLRIGTQIFAENDVGTYVSQPSTGNSYVEEFVGRGGFTILASRRVVTPDDICQSGIRDAKVAGLGEDFTKIEEDLSVPDHTISVELDHDEANSEYSYASSRESESESSGHAYETWSEGSSHEEDSQFEDDFINPWTGRAISLRQSTPQLSDTLDVSGEGETVAGSESSELEEPLPLSAIVNYGRYRGDTSSDDDEAIQRVSSYLDGSDDDASAVHPGRLYGRKHVSKGTRASITVFDTTSPVPTKLFHFTRMLPFILYSSPPVAHPSESLVVWPLSRGDVLFADFQARTFFVRKLRPSTAFTRHVFMKCHFSPCGHYLHIASLEGQRKPVLRRRQKKGASRPPLKLAVLVLTYRLSQSKPTKSPPSLIYSTRINLREVTTLSVSRLPFTLTWTETELYLTVLTDGDHTVQLYRIGLFKGSNVLVPRNNVLLPDTARMRAIHYFPPGGASTLSRVIIGSEAHMAHSKSDRFFGPSTASHCVTEDTFGLKGTPSLPIGCYFTESDLGGWITSTDRSDIPTDLGIGRLDHRLEKFDPEEDCDLEPYIS